MSSLTQSLGSGTTRDKALSLFANIPWSEYVRARAFLTQEEVDILRACEDASLDITLGDQHASRRLVVVLQKVVALINDAAAQQYALTRIDDILSGKSDLENGAEIVSHKDLLQRAKLFESEDTKEVDVSLFMRVLRADFGADAAYLKGCAAMSLARLLLGCSNSEYGGQGLEAFVAWICDQLAQSGSLSSSGSSEPTVLSCAAKSLTILLRRPEPRRLFCQHGGVGYLTKLLKSSSSSSSSSSFQPPPGEGPVSLSGGSGSGGGANAQLLYEVTLSLWTLSFDSDTRPLYVAAGAVPALADQVTAAPREKVVRVAIGCLANLCHVSPADSDDGPSSPSSSSTSEVTAQVTSILIAAGLPKTLSNMKERAWSDSDVVGDIETLYNALMANYRELSTFERWQSEVSTKQLKWGSRLVHCEKFWRENASALERHDFKELKALISCLDAMEPEVVAVACYDLGEFVRFYPNGKSVVKSLGGKDQCMLLIDHGSPEVQREALQCMSKIMVNQWEFMGR